MQARSKLVRAKYVKGEATLEKIREACMEEIITRGYHHTSVCEIVRRARLTRGAFYNYWVSLDDCIADLILAVREIVRNDAETKQFAETLDEPSELLKKLRVLLYFVLEKNYKYLVFPLSLLSEKDLANQELRALLAEYVESAREEWTEVVRLDQQSGLIRADLDAGAIAVGNMTFIRGMLDNSVLKFDSFVEPAKQSYLLFLRSVMTDRYLQENDLDDIFPERFDFYRRPTLAEAAAD